jgi:superfamily II DNA/RNA helicase
MSVTFAQLGVPEHVCRALAARGFVEPFEIQAATIADALAGRDVCGRAPTGSGKTLAFGVPLVATVGRAKPRRPRGLVLVPTRELAEQITGELVAFGGDVRVRAIYGGVGYEAQIRDLRRGVDVLVACPGRLEDLMNQGAADLSAVDRVVLDEADQMADMGFLPVVRRLLDQTSDDRQTVLFSATLDEEVAALTRNYQRDPVHHRVDADETVEPTADHRFWLTDRADRVAVGARVIERAWPTVVFCRTRHGTDRVARQLARLGVDAVAIHGGHSQGKRARALDRFTSGRAMALVATDVAARGIHVDGVAAVLHFDVPADHKTYVHRSGRTARAGSRGLVVSLVLPHQVNEVRRIQTAIELDRPIEPPVPDTLEVANLPERRPVPAAPDADRPTPRRRKRADGRSTGRGDRSDGRSTNRSRRPGPDPAGRIDGDDQPGRSRRDDHRDRDDRSQRRRGRTRPGDERSRRSAPQEQAGQTERRGRRNGDGRPRPDNRSNQANSSRRSDKTNQANSSKRGARSARSEPDRRRDRPAASGSGPKSGRTPPGGGGESGPKRARRRTTGRSGKPRPADKRSARTSSGRGKAAARTAQKRARRP